MVASHIAASLPLSRNPFNKEAADEDGNGVSGTCTRTPAPSCASTKLPPLAAHVVPSVPATMVRAHRRLPLWALALVSAALVGGGAGGAKQNGVPTISQILVGSRNPQTGGSEVFVLGHNLTGTKACSEAECRKRVQVRAWDLRSALAPPRAVSAFVQVFRTRSSVILFALPPSTCPPSPRLPVHLSPLRRKPRHPRQPRHPSTVLTPSTHTPPPLLHTEKVKIGDAWCSTTSARGDEVKAVAPPGKGYNLPVLVRVGGKDSTPYAGGFSYDGRVQSAHPLSSSIKGGTMLRIKGTGFRDDGATTYVCYFSAGSIAREISADIESSSAIKCRTPDWPYVCWG